MATISAAMVKTLRERTGQAMMDCKRALVETNGDMEKAVDLLRKKGKAVLDKRSGKETSEGRVVGKVSDNGKKSVLAALCCETDFTANNEAFQQAVQAIADALMAADTTPASQEEVMNLKTADGRTVSEVINDLVSQTGEKITLGEFARYELEGSGLLHCYVHFNNKIATMLQIDSDKDETAAADVTKTLAADLAMHVTAINPVALNKEQVDPELVAREREVAASQVAGKPENLVEKIVDGKINKWFQQIVFLEQPFVKDDSQKVKDVVAQAAKQAGGSLEVKRFVRIQIG